MERRLDAAAEYPVVTATVPLWFAPIPGLAGAWWAREVPEMHAQRRRLARMRQEPVSRRATR
jgi:hypothetical protein